MRLAEQQGNLLRTLALCAGVLLGAGGCSTARIHSARIKFMRGEYEGAEKDLAVISKKDNNRLLALMERGMIRQAKQDYKASTDDWLEAQRLAEDLDYYSISKDSASLVVNDHTMPYRGEGHERALLHVFAAKNYLALSKWEDAAVEARNVVYRLEKRGDQPDDAYSRYMAAVCFELINDHQAAAFQYRLASELARGVEIDEISGWISLPAKDKKGDARVVAEEDGTQLICFLATGSMKGVGKLGQLSCWQEGSYAEIHAGEKYLGRTHLLSDVGVLHNAAEKGKEGRKTVKTITRIILKEVLVQAVATKDEDLAELLRVILIELEVPDYRHWETLPRYLHVARVNCPDDLQSYSIVMKDRSGKIVSSKDITGPITRSGERLVSFCRCK